MLKKGKLVTITRKIELKINVTDKEERGSIYNKLRRWGSMCVEGANQIVSHLFFQLCKDKMVYMNERAKIHEANKELDEQEIIKLVADSKKDIYKVVAQESREMLITSPQNSLYQVLSSIYKGNIPTAILTSLSQTVFKSFNEEKVEILSGKRSIRNYKSGMPIPIRGPDITNVRISTIMENILDKETGEVTGQKEKKFKDVAFTLYGIPFRTNFGRDRSDNENYFKKALSLHFLPRAVREQESKLSENIVHSKKVRWEVTLGNINYHIALEKDDHGVERFYQVTVLNVETNISFKMMRDEKKDPAAKEKKIISYRIVSDLFLLDSSISIEKRQMKNSKDGRKEATNIYLNAVIQFEKKKEPIDKNKVAYCYLDPKVPIRVVIDDKEYSIGNVEALNHRRTSIQEQTRKLQRRLAHTQGGHGRLHKMRTLDIYKGAESNYFSNKAHQYSRKLVGLCLEHHVGNVVLKEMEEKKDEAKEDKRILRNWGYFKLNTLIAYKLAIHGIEFVDESKPEEDTE